MKKNLIKKLGKTVFIGLVSLALAACGNGNTESKGTEKATETIVESSEEKESINGEITLAAAASLEKVMTEKLIPMFNESYPDINIIGTYDSSGKLQAQIEEGADVDIFFSAGKKQMDALIEKGLMQDDSVTDLLKNNIVLIVQKDKENDYTEFADIVKSEIIAIGNPDTTPAGQYAKIALTNLGLWDEVEPKLSLGGNVTEVLNWVTQGSAEAGIVYVTDAYKVKDQVSIVGFAPEGSVETAVYPIGITASSESKDISKLFVDFLNTKEAKEIFEGKGFIVE